MVKTFVNRVSTVYDILGSAIVNTGEVFCKSPVLKAAIKSQRAALSSALLTADNQTALMGEGSHLDEISKTHLRDKRAAASSPPEECQLGKIFSGRNY